MKKASVPVPEPAPDLYRVAIAQFNFHTDDSNKPGRNFFLGEVYSATVFGDELDMLVNTGAIVRFLPPVQDTPAEYSDADSE